MEYIVLAWDIRHAYYSNFYVKVKPVYVDLPTPGL